VTIAGHINEAPDLFAEDYAFPAVSEGDIVALLNVGSYCQAAGGTHCLRPVAPAVYFEVRLGT
jgi:diaminopimelate decarboxylase